jgi:hypothetical protein
MNPRVVTTLALRMLGVYALLQAIYPLGAVVGEIAEWARGDSSAVRGLLGLTFVVAAFLVVGLALIHWAPSIAARFSKADKDAPELPSPDAAKMEIVGYRLLGVYAIVTFAPSLLSNFIDLIGEEWELRNLMFFREWLRSMLGTALGIYLMLGARGIAGFIARMRAASVADLERRAHRPAE